MVSHQAQLQRQAPRLATVLQAVLVDADEQIGRHPPQVSLHLTASSAARGVSILNYLTRTGVTSVNLSSKTRLHKTNGNASLTTPSCYPPPRSPAVGPCPARGTRRSPGKLGTAAGPCAPPATAPSGCFIEAPWLVSGGHGASLRQPFGLPTPAARSAPRAHPRPCAPAVATRAAAAAGWPCALAPVAPGRFVLSVERACVVS